MAQNICSSSDSSFSAQQRSAADAVVENNDLVTEIFLRLPVKPLTQFKCVSKHWLSLISDTQFSLRHARRNREPISALFLRSLQFKPEFAFVPFDDCLLGAPHFQSLGLPGTTILHSCNGLLCYSKFDDSADSSILGYHVCNPTTKRSARIPLLGLVHIRRIRRGSFRVQHRLCNVKVEESTGSGTELNINLLGVYVACDPLKSPHYRVVCVWEWNAFVFNYEIRIAVYCSEIGLWVEPTGPFQVPYATCFNNGVFWNGRMHWISNNDIVCFEVDGADLKIMSLPLNPKAPNVVYFGESRGRLQLVLNDKATYALLNVFEMQRDYSGWVLKYCCDIDPVMVIPRETVSNYMPRAFSLIYLDIGEKKDESHLVLGIFGKVISYSPKNKTSKEICDLPQFFLKIDWAASGRYKAFSYCETLFEV